MNPSNYSTIYFPLLNIEVDPGRYFSIGNLQLHYYGLIIGIGLLLAVWYGCRRSKQFGIKEDDLLDGVLWVTPFAIICARAYYCAFSWEDFAGNPISVFYVWNGGLAIYGGVLGALAGVIVLSKVKKLKMTALLDLVALGFLIGQSLGRWGNFFNREAFGAATESIFRMGLLNNTSGVVEYYHPTFLYESLWNACGFVLLHVLSKKRRYDGQIALGYAAWYGFGRSFIEALRVDSLYWGPFRVSQLLAAVSCFAATSVLLVQWFREHDPAAMQVNIAAKAEAEAKLAAENAEEAEEDTSEAAEEVEQTAEAVSEEEKETE